MKKLIWLILLLPIVVNAQRWYGINDSTTYHYDNVNVVVGKHKIYLNQNNNLSLIQDFTDANEPNNYIRDFDFIDAQKWFVLVGSRYIGSNTTLYHTSDSGLHWNIVVPESFTVPASIEGKAQSINQVQFTNGRIYIFDRYYISRVFYSDDLGQTWTHWFEGFWSHYYHIFTCNSDLYLQGMPGDGFRS